jgi:DNA-binding CsgD family transcriptional regulator
LNVLCFDLILYNEFNGRIYIPEPSTEGIYHTEPDNFQANILRVMNSRRDAVWYMTDVSTGKNLYTSESVKEVIGWDSLHFNLGGYAFFFSIMHPDDHVDHRDRHLEWILLNNKLGPLFENVQFSKNVRLRGMNGKYKTFHVESYVLEHTHTGKVKIEFGFFEEVEQSEQEKDNTGTTVNHIRMIDGKVYIEVEYLKDLERQHSNSTNANAFNVLTAREKEVMQLIVDTCSSKDISEKLDLSIHTVNLHRKQIMKKLRANNLAELIRMYYQNR